MHPWAFSEWSFVKQSAHHSFRNYFVSLLSISVSRSKSYPTVVNIRWSFEPCIVSISCNRKSQTNHIFYRRIVVSIFSFFGNENNCFCAFWFILRPLTYLFILFQKLEWHPKLKTIAPFGHLKLKNKVNSSFEFQIIGWREFDELSSKLPITIYRVCV